MARNSTLHIAIRDDVKRELQVIAERYGLTASALGAFIIGQWIDAQKRYVYPLVEGIHGEFKRVVRESLEEVNKEARA